MAREKRRVSENGIYMVSLRGNELQLFKDSRDYDEFIGLLEKYFDGENGILAYSLSEDTAEFVVKTQQSSITAAMKPLLTSYARYYNRTYMRTGKVFYDRYKSEPVPDERVNALVQNLKNKVGGEKVKDKTISETGKKAETKNEEIEKLQEKKEPVHTEKKMDFWLL